MALVFSLRPQAPASFRLLTPRPRRLPSSLVASAATAAASGPRSGAALVWFKNDLRVDDHPGLVAAVAKHETVVPLYVFDHRILSNLCDEMLEMLIFSLKDLKDLLKGQGSDLLLGYGSTEDVILEIVNKVKPSHIYAEEESEYDLRKLTTTVESSLFALRSSYGSPEFVFWRSPFYNIKNFEELPESHDCFRKMKPSVTLPLPAPTLPNLNMEMHCCVLPSLVDVKKFLVDTPGYPDESWLSYKNTSAKSVLKMHGDQIGRRAGPTERRKHDGKEKQTSLNLFNAQRTTNPNSMFVACERSLVKGGTNNVLNALAAYLRYLEGTARDDWQELHDKSRNAESRKGASFGALFGSALYFGTISRRRVYYEAIKYEKERNAGFISPFGYSAPTVAAAVDAVCSMEWYSLLALKSQISNKGIYPSWIWRWRGYLIQARNDKISTASSFSGKNTFFLIHIVAIVQTTKPGIMLVCKYTAAGNEGPAVLLVHGFGAFLEHFRGNINDMADAGYRVWAVTLLGFGHSEKPNIIYTELLWAELLRDFIVDVVKEPVHLAGNSLGGYFVAIVAGLWPSLVKSVILMNTAGLIVPNYSSIPFVDERKVSSLAWLQVRLLLLYLRSSAGKIMKKCYPINVDRADSWLIGEIIRASFDPGVAIVLESIVNFNLSIPLNYLIDSYGGEVLIVQGMKDPLTKSVVFLSMVREHCSKVTISELDAGHCPHDEVPEKVNAVLREWITSVESKHILERV